MPYFFPGVVAIALWLFSRERLQPWRLLTFLAVVGSAVGLLILAPYSWSGGGGPTGNRYIIGVYAATFFLTPPLTSTAPALLAWLGGALFTAKMLMNPFVAAKSPYLTTERGFARWLPVEVTMANRPILKNSLKFARGTVSEQGAGVRQIVSSKVTPGRAHSPKARLK